MAQKQPQFHYVAQRRTDRKVFEDDISAPSGEAVKELLVSKGYIPLEVRPAGGSGLNTELSFGGKKRFKKKDIAVWARQFAIMVNAGLPVVKALMILEEQSEKETLKDATREIRLSIEAGKSLGEAMEAYVDDFGDLIINMVKAGEAGGFLDGTLSRIALDTEKDVKLRAKIKSAMTYPVVVLCMAIGLTTAMLIFVVPVFTKMFNEMGGKLPLPTQILVWLSDAIKVGIIPTIIGIVIFMMWWKKNKRKEWVRNLLDPLKLKAPIFGGLVSKIALARFSRNLGTLLHAGVPLVKSLDVVNGTIGNIMLERALNDVKFSVEQGESMSAPLAEHEVFPAMVVQMIAVGEDAGNIEVMLEKIAEDYDAQVETMTEQLASLIEPFMIAFLGVVVGGMVIALYMPIFQIFTLVNGG